MLINKSIRVFINSDIKIIHISDERMMSGLKEILETYRWEWVD